jgi:hypothetical protein
MSTSTVTGLSAGNGRTSAPTSAVDIRQANVPATPQPGKREDLLEYLNMLVEQNIHSAPGSPRELLLFF